jgi:hypothetical protein
MMRVLMILGLTAALAGCATPLSSPQKREYEAMKGGGMLIEEKTPATGAVLGLLPGGGSFYAREPALGVVNLLLWPLSILWDPISGYEGSKSINYDASKQEARKKREREIEGLDDKLKAGQISNTEYLAEKQKLDKRYEF